MTRSQLHNRRGVALPIALLGLVVIGALMAGAFFSSAQEFKVGRNTMVSQRAFSVAEYGLNYEIANWNRRRFLPGDATYMQPGDVDDTHRVVANGDTAMIKVTRLNDNTFWVVSEGYASMGNKQLKSRQRTNAVVRIAYPSVSVRGALTTAGDVTVNGNARVYGNDMGSSNDSKVKKVWENLATWGQCPSIGTDDKAGISLPPDRVADVKANAVDGTPDVEKTTIAAADSTYIKFGDENWNTLTANADIKLASSPSFKPFPRLDASGKCDLSSQENFGEPYRVASAGKDTPVPDCSDYFPIIYVNGNADFNGGRGQGILIVNGNLNLRGGFEWYGLIIVKDEVTKGNGTADVFGAIMSQSANINAGGTDNDQQNTLVGDLNVWYSKCALESALRGSAILIPVKQRSWAQFF
jgi:hypothetical protein